MENIQSSSPFFKSTLTGLFAGIVATVVCLFFNATYRNATGFLPAAIINVSSLIFVVNLIFLCFGLLHYLLRRLFKSGELIYIILFTFLTLGCIWLAKDAHRSTDTLVNAQFKGLLQGVITITGICAAVLVPVLFHSKKFEKEVLGNPEI